MKRYICLILIAITVLLTAAHVYAAQPEVTVVANGEKVMFRDQKPVIVDGRTLVPLRGVFEQLGCRVTWTEKTKTAHIQCVDDVLDITIGSADMYLNGKCLSLKLDCKATLIGSRSYIPLRFAAEVLGFQVSWNQKTWTVTVKHSGVITHAEALYETMGGDKNAASYIKGRIAMANNLKKNMDQLNNIRMLNNDLYDLGFLIIDMANVPGDITKALENSGSEFMQDVAMTTIDTLDSSNMTVSEYFYGLGKVSYQQVLSLYTDLVTLHSQRMSAGYFSRFHAIAYVSCYYYIQAYEQALSTAVKLLCEDVPSGVLDAVKLTTKKFVFHTIPGRFDENFEQVLIWVTSDTIEDYREYIRLFPTKLLSIINS